MEERRRRRREEERVITIFNTWNKEYTTVLFVVLNTFKYRSINDHSI